MELSEAALVSWEFVKAILGLDDSQERLTALLINAASAQAERYAGRILAARQATFTMDTDGGDAALLPSYPVGAVDRLCLDATGAFPQEKDLAPEEYSLLAGEGIIRLRKRRFPRGRVCLLFAGILGYDPVPGDLQQAVVEVVAANLRRLESGGAAVGLKSISAPNGIGATYYEIDIPVSSRNIFASYRSVRI
jgi:uncharacterized phiE125 gp8 family phage protein